MTTAADSFMDLVRAVIHYPLFTMGGASFTLAVFGKFLRIVLFIVVLERLFRRHFLKRALARTNFAPALQFAILRITGYLFVILGVHVAFQAMGVDLNSTSS